MRIQFLFLSTVVVGRFLYAQASGTDPALQPYQAHATAVTGQVSRIRDQQPWAVSAGEGVPVRQIITAGPDGYAHFVVAGGSNFDIYANSRIAFRSNRARAGDLLDVLAGRVRVHLQPTPGIQQQRIFTPVAIVVANESATVTLAVDEDGTVRIDVIEGEVRVQHLFLPKNEPTLVRAVDAILVSRNQPISHQVDRGSLYRFTVRSLKDIWSAVTPGHSNNHGSEPIEQKFLAEAMPDCTNE